ncbi:MAG: hypothetical protein KGV43_00655, partial [Arcobacter sp.]|nr:hypothetical protein [Arcobacter sp.]
MEIKGYVRLILTSFLFISFFLSACGGGSSSTNTSTSSSTFAIEGYVIDEFFSNSDITLYNSKKNKILETKTDKTGKYVFDFSKQIAKTLANGEFLYLEVLKNDKKLRGLILNYTNTNKRYLQRDTYISSYSEALFQIKDALNLDLNSLSKIYDNFLNSYKKGKLEGYKYHFAFAPIMEDMVENIKAGLYNDTKLYTKNGIISKIKRLNYIDISVSQKTSVYSVPILKEKDKLMSLQIISFK